MARKRSKKQEPSRKILARRTEKQWRHEDRELTSTHFLWNAAITAHAVIIAASGILVGNDKFPLARWLFPLIVICSVLAIGGIIKLMFALRSYDSISAAHFRSISEMPPFPDPREHRESENKCNRARERYV